MSSLANRLRIWVGDITKLRVDAIVNAANEALCGDGGVDGAIHRAAGPALLQECLKIGGCPTGEARITKGHLLPAKFIIHAVGPVYEGGGFGEAELLASCYSSSLKLAAAQTLETLAFSCIATGVYGFPKDEASQIAVRTVSEWLARSERPREVIFCCFGEADAAVYRKRFRESGLEPNPAHGEMQ
jgi:O-acetyl-ADP-ribose deacetylase (regulator of RNase III)